jgi:hypothetical protein
MTLRPTLKHENDAGTTAAGIQAPPKWRAALHVAQPPPSCVRRWARLP